MLLGDDPYLRNGALQESDGPRPQAGTDGIPV